MDHFIERWNSRTLFDALIVSDNSVDGVSLAYKRANLLFQTTSDNMLRVRHLYGGVWNSGTAKTPRNESFTQKAAQAGNAQSRQAMLLDKQDQVLIVCWSLKEPLLGALSSCMPCLLPSLKEPLFCQALVSLSEMLSFVETLPVRISQREISCMSLSRLFAVSAAWMGCTW